MSGPDIAAAASLRDATKRFREAVAAGVRPLAAGDEFFDVAALAVSQLRSQTSPEGDASVLDAANALVECGDHVFAASPDDTRVLHQLLQWAKHLARTLPDNSPLLKQLEDRDRTWHWRTLG